jgi:hypothetical protein
MARSHPYNMHGNSEPSRHIHAGLPAQPLALAWHRLNLLSPLGIMKSLSHYVMRCRYLSLNPHLIKMHHHCLPLDMTRCNALDIYPHIHRTLSSERKRFCQRVASDTRRHKARRRGISRSNMRFRLLWCRSPLAMSGLGVA